jgi:capsule polysaccharide modification protein KpsS
MSANKDYAEMAKRLKTKLQSGEPVPFDRFIYIPLQVDTPTSDGKPDFKFRFTGFKNNREFLDEIAKVVPKGVKILVKNHPANKKPTKVPAGMVDISKANFSKCELYQRMLAMVAINSTSVLEAMCFGRHVFTYGQDIFSGKALAHESVRDKDVFAATLATEPLLENQKRFIGYLFQRQFYRHKWEDKDYVRSHHWNQVLRPKTTPKHVYRLL